MSLYCRTERPSLALKIIVTFIVKAYMPMILDVLLKPEFYNGSIHLFNYLKRARLCLRNEYFDVVKKCWITNGYFFHPENLLLCAYLSPLSPARIKSKALNLILKAREIYTENTDKVRDFKVPTAAQLNLDNVKNIACFFDILDWNNLPTNYITFAPLLRIFSNDELKEGLNNPLNVPRLLCHSQHNERAVKQTSESVKKHIGKEFQKTNIIVVGESRKAYPKKKLKKTDIL